MVTVALTGLDNSGFKGGAWQRVNLDCCFFIRWQISCNRPTKECSILTFLEIYIHRKHGWVESRAGPAQAHYWLHTYSVVRMWMEIGGRRA